MIKTKLAQRLTDRAEEDGISYKDIFDTKNQQLSILGAKYKVRPYQKESLGRFIYYMESFKNKQKPIHLLFNLATGAGKTLLMAWLIGYLKEKYDFQYIVFLVNRKEIVNKTLMNFTEKSNHKYLFSENLPFQVQVVENFTPLLPSQIGIKFTTIQGLASELSNPGNGTLTFEEFKGKKILFLADESHHLNADTKSKKSKEEETEVANWETLIKKLVNANQENMLLEFTATVPKHPLVLEKYIDKVIYQYGLKEYREDKYSKDVDLIRLPESSSGDTEEHKQKNIKLRVLLALLLSQYRTDVFQNKIKKNITAKILFKSKDKDSNKSNFDYLQKLLDNLKPQDYMELFSMVSKFEGNSDNDATTHLANAFKHYANDQFISLVNVLRASFTFDNVIKGRTISRGSIKIVDSDNNKDLDYLKDLDNPTSNVRAIFAVDMLNEGWDVLSLFDIVRLYDTRSNVKDVSTDKIKVGPQTVTEAQIIGRGARYCPFHYGDSDADKRKFDSCTEDEKELRVLEKLFYYSGNNSMYVSELKKQLTEDGIYDAEPLEEKAIKIKPIFKKNIENSGVKLYVNSGTTTQVKIDLPKLKAILEKEVKVYFDTRMGATNLNSDESIDSALVKHDIKIADLSKNAVFMAFSKLGLTFSWLSNNFTKMESMESFYKELKLAKIGLHSDIPKNELLANPKNHFYIAWRVLSKLMSDIFEARKHQTVNTYTPKNIFDIIKESKTIRFQKGKRTVKNSEDDWFSHDILVGTGHEISLYESIQNYFEKNPIKGLAVEKFYLLRNEQDFKLLNENGDAFAPDFVLFLILKDRTIKVCQVFIEPKGEHLEDTDKWKEDALFSLSIKDGDAFVCGLDFYNPEENNNESYYLQIQDKLDSLTT